MSSPRGRGSRREVTSPGEESKLRSLLKIYMTKDHIFKLAPECKAPLDSPSQTVKMLPLYEKFTYNHRPSPRLPSSKVLPLKPASPLRPNTRRTRSTERIVLQPTPSPVTSPQRKCLVLAPLSHELPTFKGGVLPCINPLPKQNKKPVESPKSKQEFWKTLGIVSTIESQQLGPGLYGKLTHAEIHKSEFRLKQMTSAAEERARRSPVHATRFNEKKVLSQVIRRTSTGQLIPVYNDLRGDDCAPALS